MPSIFGPRSFHLKRFRPKKSLYKYLLSYKLGGPLWKSKKKTETESFGTEATIYNGLGMVRKFADVYFEGIIRYELMKEKDNVF